MMVTLVWFGFDECQGLEGNNHDLIRTWSLYFPGRIHGNYKRPVYMFLFLTDARNQNLLNSSRDRCRYINLFGTIVLLYLPIHLSIYLSNPSTHSPNHLSFHLSLFQCYTGHWFSVAFNHIYLFTASSDFRIFCFITVSFPFLTSFGVSVYFFLPFWRSDQ